LETGFDIAGFKDEQQDDWIFINKMCLDFLDGRVRNRVLGAAERLQAPPTFLL
jgi:hypothetical protein